MAVKIITKGTKERPTYTRTCPECKCVFKYNYLDTIKSGWNGGYTYVPCPTCSYPVAHLVAGGGDDINHPSINGDPTPDPPGPGPTPSDTYTKAQIDQKDSNTLSSAKSYTYSQSQIDQKDADTLTSAKGYTYSQSQIDQKDADNLNTAKSYTYSQSQIDQKDTDTLNSAKQYTNQSVQGFAKESTVESISSGDTVTVTDNTIFTGSDISALTIEAGTGTCLIEFDTASTGALTITISNSIKFASTPTFSNGMHYEIAVKDGYANYMSFNL